MYVCICRWRYSIYIKKIITKIVLHCKNKITCRNTLIGIIFKIKTFLKGKLPYITVLVYSIVFRCFCILLIYSNISTWS